MGKSKITPLLKHFLKEYQLPILSGVLIGTSYIPFPPWASMFGFVPLWLFCVKQNNIKKVLIAAWLSQFVLTFIGFNWVAHTMREFGGLPWVVSIAGLIAHCSFANFYIPAACAIWFFLQKKLQLKPLPSFLALGLATALCEIYLQIIFHWNFGYTWLWSGFPIYQIAEYIGFQGISTYVILCNALFAWAWHLRPKFASKMVVAGIVTSFLVLNLLGLVVAHHVPKANSLIRPLIVQANISNQQKVYAEQGRGFRGYILNKFFQLTEKGMSGEQYPDFAIWPETAFPEYLNDLGSRNVWRLKNFIKEKKLPIVTGAYSKHSQGRSSNGMYFLGDDGSEWADKYIKSILLAFGEFVPFGDTFPILKKMLPMVADFKRGKGPVVRNYLDTKFGPQICYEALYPKFTKSLADQGAEVIINVTNDSWFGWWQEPYQHLYMTLARAIEFRRPVIRSTNTGVSTVILASGEILEKSPLGQEWQNTYVVPYTKNPKATFYQNSINLIPALLALALLVVIFFSFYRSKKN